MNQIKLYSLLFLLFLIICCNKKTINIERWDPVTIDSKIHENKIYKDLDKEPEIIFFAEDLGSTLKKSSDVSYYFGKKININNKDACYNTCKAYFLSDTLVIRIGVESIFGELVLK